MSAKLVLSRPALGDEQLFDSANNLAKRLLSKKMSREMIGNVMTFLKYCIHSQNPEMMTNSRKAPDAPVPENNRAIFSNLKLSFEKRCWHIVNNRCLTLAGLHTNPELQKAYSRYQLKFCQPFADFTLSEQLQIKILI